MQCLSYFPGFGAVSNRLKEPALYRIARINTCFKPCKKLHFLELPEHFFDITASQDENCVSMCVKIARQKTAIKWALLSDNIGFYAFILLGNNDGEKQKIKGNCHDRKRQRHGLAMTGSESHCERKRSNRSYGFLCLWGKFERGLHTL